MPPHKIRDETLKSLRAAGRDMASMPFQIRIGSQPADVRRDAALKRLDVDQAIVALVNTALAEYRDQLIENETALLEGRQQLEQASADLARVTVFLEAVGRLLGLVGRVVTFVATA